MLIAARQNVTFLSLLSFIACGVDVSKPEPREPRSFQAQPNAIASSEANGAKPLEAGDTSSAQVIASFVDGWDLQLANVVGATLIYDPYLLGIGRVVNDHLEMLGTSVVLRELGLRLLAVAGRWPDHVWALTKFDKKRLALYRYEGTIWQSRAILEFSGYGEVRLISDKAGSAWVVLVGRNPEDGYRLIPLPEVGRSMPEIRWSSADSLRARFALPMNATDLVVARHGELTGFGEIVDASTKDPGWGIGSWRGSAHTSGSALLPLRQIEGFAFSKWCGGLDATAYVLGNRRSESGSYNYLAKWDGEALSPPLQFANSDIERKLESCTVSPDGALWFGLSKLNQRWLVKVGAHGRTTRWTLPELLPLLVWPRFEKAEGKWRYFSEPVPNGELQGYLIAQLRVLDGDDVWALGVRTLGGKIAETPGLPHEGLHRTVIFRSGKPKSMAMISWADVAADATYFMPSVDTVRVGTPLVPRSAPSSVSIEPREGPKPSKGAIHSGTLKSPKPSAETTAIAADCQPLFVAIYELTADVPKSFDFADVREVIRNRTEYSHTLFVEAEQSGQRFFGALVDEFASGEKLIRHLKASLPGVEPLLICGRISVVRSVPIGGPQRKGTRSK